MASIQGFPSNVGIRPLQGTPGLQAAPGLSPTLTEAVPAPLGDELQVNFKSSPVPDSKVPASAPEPAPQESSPAPEAKAPSSQSNAPTALGGEFFMTGLGGLAQIEATPEVVGPPGGGPVSERSVSEASLKEVGVDGEFVRGNNVRFMHTGSALFYHGQSQFEGKSVRLATAGFGEGPAGYAETTQNFMNQLGDALNGDFALVARPGSGELSDALSLTAQRQNAPILYLTDDASLGVSCQPGPGVDAEALKAAPKFSLPKREDVQSMTGVLTNRLLVTGGGNEVISDFIRSIDLGNPVVLLTDSGNPGPSFDESSGKLLKAPEFLAGMLTTGHESLGLSSDGPYGVPSHPAVYNVGRWLDMEAPKSPAELVKTAENPAGLVLILDAQDPQAAQKAAAHLKRD